MHARKNERDGRSDERGDNPGHPLRRQGANLFIIPPFSRGPR